MSLSTEQIKALPGPLLVIGAGGFLGANLFRRLFEVRQDVYGTIHSSAFWRLEGIPADKLIYIDILSKQSMSEVLQTLRPQVIFSCTAFGAYSFEKDVQLIQQTNFMAAITLLELCEVFPVKALVFSGSSSEYGKNCCAPGEDAQLLPDSSYAVSKAAAAQAICYYGKVRNIPCVNMRLYSLFGPFEDTSRLMPVLSHRVLEGKLPPFVAAETSHDFTYVGDAVDAYITVALNIRPEHYGNSYNIGTGRKVTIQEVAEFVRKHYSIAEEPQYKLYGNRSWDHDDWYANPDKMFRDFGWKAGTAWEDGLVKTIEWWREFLSKHCFEELTKKRRQTEKKSVSAIIACYRDNQAIPLMYERLKKMFIEQKVDYEIIFVNDASPDDSTEVIRSITAKDPHVIGIVHSRNFGSQAAFISGLEIASKESAVIMDGDLQDPPEMIPAFLEEWRKGADVVYGRRIKREMPRYLEFFYKTFYWLFASLSEVNIPRNAGDFSLLDRKVIRELVHCPERDYFLRGIRAYLGFKQVGVDYVRPERAFGRSTNNWIKNIGWAKKAIFAFTRGPLHLLSMIGALMTFFSFIFGMVVVVMKICFPESSPRGISMLQVSIMVFGSLNLLGLGLLGEYIGKIIEETKRRPRFIRSLKISSGNLYEFPVDQKHENL